MRLLLAIVLLGVTACRTTQVAPVADASPECYRPTVPSIDPPNTGVRWEADPADPGAWDDLANRVVPALADKALAGERARQACAGFINDLKERGVIRARD